MTTHSDQNKICKLPGKDLAKLLSKACTQKPYIPDLAHKLHSLCITQQKLEIRQTRICLGMLSMLLIWWAAENVVFLYLPVDDDAAAAAAEELSW